MIVLLHRAEAYGAVEQYAVTLAHALGNRAVLVHSGVLELERPGAHTLPIAEPSLPKIARLLRSLRPQIVHVVDVWPEALLAARIAKAPRLLLTHHTPELPRRDNLAGQAWQRIGWMMRPEVIYTSEADRERDGRTPSHVVPIGVDVDRFASAEPALPKNGPVVGNVARLSVQKNHASLIEAARRLPDGVRVVIVGEGELRDELERRAAGLPVEFTGFRDDVPELLASFDVFVMPSLFEGLCVAVLEAQAAGVPVVATPVGGVRDTVVDGETGLLVPPRDPDALAAAIIRLLEDRELARHLAAEARRRVREGYSIERMVESTLALYGGQ